MWVSSHSSAGKRLHRNTEDGHKSELDTVHLVASSPTGKQERDRNVEVNKLYSKADVIFSFYTTITENV